MYCPRCGQEQVSGNLKFCSKCGLPITLVAEVVHNGGTLPQLEQSSGKRKLFTRANGLKISAIWFIFIEMLIVPLAAIAGGEEEVAVLAVLGFVGSVIMAVMSFMFLPSAKKPLDSFTYNPTHTGAAGISETANQGALPPQRNQTADEYVAPAGNWNAADTEDLVRPGSVTEGTTRLLKKDEDG